MMSFTEAVQKHLAGDLETAGELYKKELSSGPLKLEALNNLIILISENNPKNLDRILNDIPLDMPLLGKLKYLDVLVSASLYSAARAFCNQSFSSNERFVCLGDINLAQNDDHKAAEAYARASVETFRKNERWANNYATALNRLGRFEAAIEILSLPQNFSTWNAFITKSTTLIGLRNFDKALVALEKAVSFGAPKDIVYANKARLYERKQQYQVSEKLARKALDANKKQTFGKIVLADSLVGQKRYLEGISLYDSALRVDPNNSLAGWNRCLAYFKSGNFEKGLSEYGWGFRRNHYGRGTRKFHKLWNGSDEIHTLNVWSEQGVGDIVMFAQFLRYIPKRVNINLVVEKRLKDLLERYLDVGRPFNLTAEGEVNSDFQSVSIGDLADIYWHTHINGGYVRQPFFIDRRSPQLRSKNIIGISWRGGRSEDEIVSRSIPLGTYKRSKCLSSDETFVVSLQYNMTEDEDQFLRATFGDRYLVHNFNPIQNLRLWTDLMVQCRAIVSVDNSVVHFAGALAKDVCVFLGSKTDYRWGINPETNPWYGSLQFIHGSKLSLDQKAEEIDRFLFRAMT